MKTILTAKILNPYRSHVPKGYYDPVKGHTGCDLDFVNEPIPAPCDLTILQNVDQNEMGKVTYAKDSRGTIHVIAHQSSFAHTKGDSVKKDALLGTSGNTGSRSTAPHLHYELLKPSGSNPAMARKFLPYAGDNVDPLEYLRSLEVNVAPVTSVMDAKSKEAILNRARQNRLNRAKYMFHKVISFFS